MTGMPISPELCIRLDNSKLRTFNAKVELMNVAWSRYRESVAWRRNRCASPRFKRVYGNRMHAVCKHFPVLIILGVIFLLQAACTRNLRDSMEQVKNLVGHEDETEKILDDQIEEDLQNLAVDHFNDRDYAEAGKVLDEIASYSNYDEPWVVYTRAYIDYATGNYDVALKSMNEYDPGPYEYTKLELRSLIYRAMNYLEESYDDAEAVLYTRPWYSSAMSLRWQLDIRMGKYDRAREMEGFMDKMESDGGADTQLMFAIFSRRLNERDFDGADELLDRIPSLPSAIVDETATFYDPGLQLSRAQVAVGRGELERAVGILLEISQQYPNMTDQWPYLTWLGIAAGWYERTVPWIIEGILRAGGGEGDELLSELGIEIPNSLINIEPASGPLRREEVGELLVHLSYIEAAGGNTSKALEISAKALEINPYEQDGYLIRSIALELDGDMAGALDAAVNGLIEAQWDYGLAIRYIDLARRSPSDVKDDYPDLEFIKTDFLNMAQGYVDLYPDDPDGRTRLGCMIRATGGGDYIEHFAKAYEEWPYGVDFAFNYALAFAESGDIEQAKNVVGAFSRTVNLPWLVEVYKRADETGSAELNEFADWVKSQMDPSGKFDDIPALSGITQ